MLCLESLPRARLSTSTSRSKSMSKQLTRFFDVTGESRDRNYLIPGRTEPVGCSIDHLHQSEKAKIAAFNDRFGLNR
jgi:hypothetical protein